jgi:hypothetical protein
MKFIKEYFNKGKVFPLKNDTCHDFFRERYIVYIYKKRYNISEKALDKKAK